MNSKLESLAKILHQEKENGFRDSTVVGGLDRFLDRWADELRPLLGSDPRPAARAPTPPA